MLYKRGNFFKVRGRKKLCGVKERWQGYSPLFLLVHDLACNGWSMKVQPRWDVISMVCLN